MDRKKLVEDNQGLVYSIAKKFVGCGLEEGDLVQEGMLGLIRAAEDYDPRIAKFSTHAYWWINQNIRRALKQQGQIVLPEYVHSLVRKWNKSVYHLWNKFGREPLDNEIIKHCKLTHKEIAIVLDARTVKQVDSIDRSDDDGKRIQVEDRGMHREYERIQIAEWLKVLNDQQKIVIDLRYGLNDGIVRTLEEVAVKVGYTRERVRQIEASALKEIRESIAVAV